MNLFYTVFVGEARLWSSVSINGTHHDHLTLSEGVRKMGLSISHTVKGDVQCLASKNKVKDDVRCLTSNAKMKDVVQCLTSNDKVKNNVKCLTSNVKVKDNVQYFTSNDKVKYEFNASSITWRRALITWIRKNCQSAY